MPPAASNSPEPSTRHSEDHSDDPHYHLIAADDCVLSLACEKGFFWKTVWEHTKNATLKELRKKPSCLREGDWVYIPDFTLREESCVTEKRHRFRRLGIPAYLHIRLMRDNKPRANLEYQLIIEGIHVSGKTDDDGELHESIPPGARVGILRTREGDRWSQVNLNLGELDPHKHKSGAHARLANLGYSPGSEEDENAVEILRAAIRAFQELEGLQVTGELDEQTHAQLEKLHDQQGKSNATDKKKEEANAKWKVHPDFAFRGEDMFEDIFADEADDGDSDQAV
jgi:N-acetylmuramoyl-L-alanine amidase